MYRNILVHADQSNASKERVNIAVKLATQFNAFLTGLFVIPDFVVPSYTGVKIEQTAIDEGMNAARKQSELARELFENAAREAAIEFLWLRERGEMIGTICKHTRVADLVLVGQAEETYEYDVNAGLADSLVLEVGRPVLVVPYIGAKTLGKKVMVAWNGGREAARALNDAMPLLKSAKTVYLIGVDADTPKETSVEQSSADIKNHLQRHGVNVEPHTFVAKDIEVGDMLLNRAADYGIDTIVMGAYGRSRWRETVLGGATRHMLKHSPVPLFLSH